MTRMLPLKISISAVMLTGRSLGYGRRAIMLNVSVLPVLIIARPATSVVRLSLLMSQSRRDRSSVCRLELVCCVSFLNRATWSSEMMYGWLWVDDEGRPGGGGWT